MLTPHDSSPGSVVERLRSAAQALLAEACDEIEERIARGEAARAEEYLARHPALAEDPEQALDLIYAEYGARRERGESPPRAELFTRFPQWQALLERQFQLEELLDEPTLVEGVSTAGSASAPHVTPAGTLRGRFRVLRLLAQGGIGQVLRAVDTELNREVAVKELLPALADSGKVRERFLREAEITGKLEHPGIVPVYGLGRDAGGRPYYAMRLVRGQSFQEAVREFHERAGDSQRFAGVEFQKLLRRFLHVCETVAFAHSRGIIHRDLKPANILLGPFGETLVVDWGLARSSGLEGPRPATDSLRDSGPPGGVATPVANWTSELTQVSGELIGTPAFMSPEQAAGGAARVGPASDVYSLGATLYSLLTGRAPFSGSKVGETLAQVIAGSFPRPREASRTIPRALEAICLKAMARRAEDRYQSPRALADDLEHWLADEPVTAAAEPLVARLARWGRWHRTYMVAGSLALLVVTIVSLAAALRINTERLRADEGRIEADRRNARLAFDRGFALMQDHEHGTAILWFARALKHAPTGDAALRHVILTNIDAARQHVVRRQRIITDVVPPATWQFSADGRRLLTVDGRGNGRLHDVTSGDVLTEQKIPSGKVVSAGFAAGGVAVLAIQKGGELLVRRLPATPAETADPPLVLKQPEEVGSAAFSPDGTMLGAGARAGSSSPARFWRVADGALVAEIAHSSTVNRIVFRPGTNEAVTISGGRVRLWNLADGGLVRGFVSAKGLIGQIAFTPDGKRMLAGDSVGWVSCWNADNGQRLFDVVQQSGAVTGVACASDGQMIAAAWNTGTTRAWNLDTRRPECELLRLDRFTQHLEFRPGTRQLLAAAQNNQLVLWNLPDPRTFAPPLSQQQVEAIAFSQDGKFAVTGATNGSVRLRDGVTGRVYSKTRQHAGRVKKVAVRPDGEVVLSASHDGTVRLWKAASGQPQGAVLTHRPSPSSRVEVEAAAFSPDGRVVATGDSVGIIRIWNGDTGEFVREIADLVGTATTTCFSPSGDLLAASFGAPENGVRVWDAGSGMLLWMGAHDEAVRSIVFSPDGRMALSGSNDDTARLWDARTGEPLGRPLMHRGEVHVAGFSPDGRLAVTGGYDATARLWSVPAGEPMGEPMRHEGIVLSATFSADGMRLLTGSADQSARLWDVATRLPLSSPLLHTNEVRAVAFNPTGNMALTGRVWNLPAPLPDDLPLVELWVQLTTERAFTIGENIEWLDPEALAELARAFEARAGRSWSEWSD